MVGASCRLSPCVDVVCICTCQVQHEKRWNGKAGRAVCTRSCMLMHGWVDAWVDGWMLELLDGWMVNQKKLVNRRVWHDSLPLPLSRQPSHSTAQATRAQPDGAAAVAWVRFGTPPDGVEDADGSSRKGQLTLRFSRAVVSGRTSSSTNSAIASWQNCGELYRSWMSSTSTISRRRPCPRFEARRDEVSQGAEKSGPPLACV